MSSTMSECAFEPADMSFMMMCTTFVMLQTPAMGIAQAGMIRRKNCLSIVMQTITGLVIGSLLWFTVGFTLTFGPSFGGMGLIGTFKYAFLHNVDPVGCLPHLTTYIPGLLYVSFQMMFAIMVPVIVTGAWAERMNFLAFLIFVILWPLLVYYPIAHWVWNPNGVLAGMGVMDFAGGITIHTTSGVSALIVASHLQKREDQQGRLQHHNIPLSIVGGSLIWAGWYSFNAGSALQANEQAVVAVINTHLAGCMSAMIWTIFAYLKDGHWHLTEIIGGAFAGLAAVTPGSGYITPGSAIIVGAVGGVISFYALQIVKEHLKIDDVLDVFALQGAPGIVGSLMVAFFADASVQGGNPGKDGYFISGSLDLLWAQAWAIIVVVTWTVLATNMIFTGMHAFFNVDVNAHTDEVGLDLTQLGETAYDDTLSLPLDLGEEVLTTRMCAAAGIGDLKTIKMLIFAGCDVDAQDYDGRCPLALAASEGHLQVVTPLVEQYGAKINIEDRYGNTPLEDALCHGHLDVAEYLQKKGAKFTKPPPEESKESLKFRICEAANGGSEKRLEQLLMRSPKLANFKDYDSRTPLHLACASGHLAVSKLLIFYGANPLVKDRWNLTPRDEAVRHEHPDCIEFIDQSMNQSYGSTSDNGTVTHKNKGKKDTLPSLMKVMKAAGNVMPFHEAKQSLLPQKRRDSKIELKVSHTSTPIKKERAVVNSAGTRLLCNAAGKNDIEEVRRLLKKDPESVRGVDYDGRNALHVAASEGLLDMVKCLLAADMSNINAVDRWKSTPLHEAVQNSHDDVAEYIRSMGGTIVNEERAFRFCSYSFDGDLDSLKKYHLRGESLDVSDYDGRTALHLAATESHSAIVKFLLHVAKVNPAPVDRFGNTPLDDASEPEIKEMISACLD